MTGRSLAPPSNASYNSNKRGGDRVQKVANKSASNAEAGTKRSSIIGTCSGSQTNNNTTNRYSSLQKQRVRRVASKGVQCDILGVFECRLAAGGAEASDVRRTGDTEVRVQKVWAAARASTRCPPTGPALS